MGKGERTANNTNFIVQSCLRLVIIGREDVHRTAAHAAGLLLLISIHLRKKGLLKVCRSAVYSGRRTTENQLAVFRIAPSVLQPWNG